MYQMQFSTQTKTYTSTDGKRSITVASNTIAAVKSQNGKSLGFFEIEFDAAGDIRDISHLSGAFSKPTERLREELVQKAHQYRAAN